MIPELGHFALILAAIVTLLQSTLPLYGASRHHLPMMRLASQGAIAQFGLILLAFIALTISYVTSDFSVTNVVQNSHLTQPLLYKISGVWGNHEGSLLLWVAILAFFGALVAIFGHNLPKSLKARTLSVQAMITLGFLAFMLFNSNPFLREDPPALDGMALNPLLQDPGLAFHPPFLYLGYVGFSITFSFAIAALIEGKVDAAWARYMRPWTLLAWTSLTIGIAMGSWWAYYELGWGGWWYWDPVENASFMPWLLGTALLHSAIVVEKRDALKSWTILLAILTFSLSLMGTFLVRSGVLTSVHSFAVDPTRGVFILGLLILATGGGLVMYAVRAPVMASGGVFAAISREGAMVWNNIFLSTACATVLIGTLYPLFLDALNLGKVSVGAPYFNLTFIPLMIPLLLLLPLSVLVGWKRGKLAPALRRLQGASVATLAIIFLFAVIYWQRPMIGLVGIAMAGWVLFGTVAELAGRLKLGQTDITESWNRLRHLPRSALGMTIAHAGVGIAIFGMTASMLWMDESWITGKIGQTYPLGPYQLRYEGVHPVQGENYTSQEGRFVLLKGDKELKTLTPEKRYYEVAGKETTEAAIYTNWLEDVYVSLGQQDDKGNWTARLTRHPLVPWIWLGCILCMIGGLFSLSDRRHRIGAPQK